MDEQLICLIVCICKNPNWFPLDLINLCLPAYTSLSLLLTVVVFVDGGSSGDGGGIVAICYDWYVGPLA